MSFMSNKAHGLTRAWNAAGDFVSRNLTKAAAVGAGMVAAPLAMAQATTPGAAIAGELSSGKSDVMLVVAAAAVIIGVLVLWSYVKRAR